MRVYYFTDEKFALENLRKRHLKISFPNEVNDLFELTSFDFGEGPKRQQHRRVWRQARNTYSQKQGFVSFSENWEVPTMWAHYAHNHLGVCYGFDIEASNLVQIQYKPQLLPFDHNAFKAEEANRKIIDYASRTKSTHWTYEQEWRRYISLNSEERRAKSQGQKLFFIKFCKGLKLQEVIIGAESKLNSDDITKALGELSKDVMIRTARPSFREFKMVPQENKRLQK